MLEDTQVASAILQDRYKVKYYRHRALNNGETGDVLQKIRTQYFKFIFVEFPISGRHVAKEDMHKTCATICHWAKAGSDNETPFVLFGSEGKKWMEPQISALVDTKV